VSIHGAKREFMQLVAIHSKHSKMPSSERKVARFIVTEGAHELAWQVLIKKYLAFSPSHSVTAPSQREPRKRWRQF